MSLDIQSSKDLEFHAICANLSSYCKSEKAKENALKINFFENVDLLDRELNLLQEIKLIHEDDKISFPHPSSEDIDHALKILRIENGVLILQEVIKVYNLCIGTKQLIDFATRHKSESPLIFDACSHIDQIDKVLLLIRAVLDEKKLTIKDDATPLLKQVRDSQKQNWTNINRNFEKALKRCKQDDILGEVEETFLDDRRLLSVFSQYKKQVNGKVRGVSAKGTYTYIEPGENIEINKSQERLRLEEKNEVYRILEELTLNLRAEKSNLNAFQRLLVRFDLLNAKVLFGISYGGIKPKVNANKKMYWQNAKHPLLLLKNNEVSLPTIGQTIELDEEHRFLVISGPNAGGKSITLKTVGLLQIMLQCGLFIPIDDVSECCWFEKVLSDIGDNQSIENQLSTYSYRLNRMQQFLTNADKDTLLLLDEFGSGSDPELGGAMAEVFYEELYQKDLFAVITTHYTNIKILTSTLTAATNACMLFDTKKLEPLYQLSIGQPGSSFTFEVAQYNGISTDLIAKAKLKVSDHKLKIDELTVSLQQEKSRFNKINAEQYKSKNKANKTVSEFESKLDKLTEKAEKQTLFFEQQNKFINTGRKVYDLIKKHKHHKTNKVLNEEIKKFVLIEKTKVLEAEKPVVFDKKLKLPDLPKIKKTPAQLEEIAEVKKVEANKQASKTLKVGDSIKLKNHSSKGIIKEIKGDKLMVMVGNFMVTTTLNENQSESENTKISKELNKERKQSAAQKKAKEQELEKPILEEPKPLAPELPVIKETPAPPEKIAKVEKKPVVKKIPKKPEVGDTVKLKNQSSKGVIQEIKGNKIMVLIGNFMITTKASEIE